MRAATALVAICVLLIGLVATNIAAENRATNRTEVSTDTAKSEDASESDETNPGVPFSPILLELAVIIGVASGDSRVWNHPQCPFHAYLGTSR